MKLWSRWLNLLDSEMDPRPLALVRIALPLCVIADLLRLFQLGLMDDVFTPFSQGGLSKFQSPHWVAADWFGGHASMIMLALTLVCMILVSLGTWMRPAILLGVLAYAQLGHLYPPGDRAIDRLIRTALLILLFSQADAAFSLRRVRAVSIPAWPAWFLRYFLVLVYLSAGMAKLIQQPGWLSLTADPPLLRILVDPMAARLDPVFWTQFPELFRWAGFGTIAYELSSPLLLTRHAHRFAIIGLFMHLGIAVTMSLGMFSWGVLACYPLFLAPFILRRLDRSGG
jgi:hypothetical protein